MPSHHKLFKLEQNNGTSRRVMRNGYKFVDHHDRVAIIYDNLVHDLQPMAISKARNIHYNTVRHILHRFYEDGHLKIKKSINNGSSKAKDQTTSSQKEQDHTQADSGSDHELVVQIPEVKSKRRYRKKIVKAKVQCDIGSQQTADDSACGAPPEPVKDFIIPGPLQLDMSLYQSVCPIALFVAVDDKEYETVGREGLGICGEQRQYPFDIPKLNQAEYQDERGEIGDKYQISDILKSIKTQMTEIQGAADSDGHKAGQKKCKQILKSNVDQLQSFLESGLKSPNQSVTTL